MKTRPQNKTKKKSIGLKFSESFLINVFKEIKKSKTVLKCV